MFGDGVKLITGHIDEIQDSDWLFPSIFTSIKIKLGLINTLDVPKVSQLLKRLYKIPS